MPEGAEEGIHRGMYLYFKAQIRVKPDIQLMGSGSILCGR